MTPEERGGLVVTQYEQKTGTKIDLNILVAAAITEAVKAERAACAKEAHMIYDSSKLTRDSPGIATTATFEHWNGRMDAAELITSAIEARNNPAPSPLDKSATHKGDTT